MFDYSFARKNPLREALNRQLQEVDNRFHVPAHQSFLDGCSRSELDLTEVAYLDNLFHPTGALAKSQQLAAEFFHAEATYYLVNGSTAGLMAAIWACCRPGDRVIVARNVHRAVIDGLVWCGAEPCFVQVEDYLHGIPLNIRPWSVERVLESVKNPQAMLVTSPSYWGITPSLFELRQLAAQRGIRLIVDEAHGGHFIFHSRFPLPAAASGADLWVNSAHKTLGALTPGALLHRRGDRVEIGRLEAALGMLQTSSPPYPVLASLEAVMEKCAGDWEEVLQIADDARLQINDCPGFFCLEVQEAKEKFGLDPLRLTIVANRISLSGFQLSKLLREKFGIEVEMSSINHVVALIHPWHRWEQVKVLINALKDIANSYYKKDNSAEKFNEGGIAYPIPRLAAIPRQAAESRWREVPLPEACGCVSAVTVLPFPPGIPVLIPGEVIEKETIERIEEDYRRGCCLVGLNSSPGLNIMVVAD